MRTWQTIPAAAKPYLALLSSSEKKFGLPDTLLTRIASIESNFDPNAKNPSGAVGMMQLIPQYHPDVNPLDPSQAIPYAASYLASLKKKFGSWEKAIAAYNWGEGNLAKYSITPYGAQWRDHLPAETKKYLDKVEAVIDLA